VHRPNAVILLKAGLLLHQPFRECQHTRLLSAFEIGNLGALLFFSPHVAHYTISTTFVNNLIDNVRWRGNLQCGMAM
jgi:hypothetical protein